MAELNVSRPDDRDPEPSVDPQHLLPESTDAPPTGTIGAVDDPELARLQIEQTRARMSDTLERIEESLARKKDRIEERMDVLGTARRTVRDRGLVTVGGVFAVGLVLGWLTGGGDDEEPEPAVRRFAPDFDRERTYVDHWEERAHTWEERARRLMKVANDLERELMETRGETLPIRRRRSGRAAEPGRPRSADGMPLPPQGGGSDPLPAPV